MAGFTAISERLGEEGTFGLIQPIYELMAAAVQEQGGSVKDFTGDGIMALFGVPEALEDAPLRACRAALLIQERLATQLPRIESRHGVRPRMRVGINTGPAIVTTISGDHAAMTALGDTVNMASRLEGIAEPGTVLLSEASYRLVQGLVDASFVGAREIKGKSEPQRTYRLDGIRAGAARFDAAVSRGLTAYVGRERELGLLEKELANARTALRTVDIVAEPGMGKSRLIHEFGQRLDRKHTFVLNGNCTPDGQKTAFLPFIEIMRGSFQLNAGEPEPDIARKLSAGLRVLGRLSPQNLGLLLNLLGLPVPDSALAGLDGVMIGVRTRDLLQQLLDARCRVSPVVLVIEDVHWIDSASEEVLGRFVRGESALPLLILHTRRPEYRPPWLSAATMLPLSPLRLDEIRDLLQHRLGIERIPERLARLIADKAEGNALFAEEIVSFLVERGVIRTEGGKVVFDVDTMADVLPASVQSLLTARVDRLASADRALLQAASVIGRSFNPLLLTTIVADAGNIGERLEAMCEVDLLRRERSGDYAFKHALVRDALYQSLLSGPRTALHFKVAQEIERRGGNRLAEVAEALARHYSQTERADKAFTYLAMAGSKGFGVYSLGEAENHLSAALALLDKHADCADDRAIAELLADYAQLSNLNLRPKATTETVERYRSRLNALGDSELAIVIGARYLVALTLMARYREAEAAQEIISAMASRLVNSRANAYAFICELEIASVMARKSLDTYENFARTALAATSESDEPAIHFTLKWFLAQEEFTRGRMSHARVLAEDMMAAGRRLNDPVTTGLALALFGWLAIFMDDYEAALEYGEDSVRLAVTPFDRLLGSGVIASSRTLLRRPNSTADLKAFRDQCIAADNWYWVATTEVAWGVTMMLDGEVGRGLRYIEDAILQRETEGQHTFADLTRLALCDVYLMMITSTEKPPLRTLLKNLPTLVRFMFQGPRRIVAHIATARQNPQFDPNGHHIGHCEAVLGFLHKAKKKRNLAIQHLTAAKRIETQFGPSPLLNRIEGALAESER